MSFLSDYTWSELISADLRDLMWMSGYTTGTYYKPNSGDISEFFLSFANTDIPEQFIENNCKYFYLINWFDLYTNKDKFNSISDQFWKNHELSIEKARRRYSK